MKDYLPQNIHQGIALALYAVFIALVKLTWIPLTALVAAHTAEYIGVSRPLAAGKKISQGNALVHTLLYGFTWWKPLKEKK